MEPLQRSRGREVCPHCSNVLYQNQEGKMSDGAKCPAGKCPTLYGQVVCVLRACQLGELSR